MTLTERIKQTKHFKSLDHIQQKMLLKKSNQEIIRHGLAVCEYRGFDYWNTTNSPRHSIKTIVEEIFG